MFDLLIHGRIVQEHRLVESYICIDDGIIRDIKRTDPGSGQFGSRINAGRSVIFPGGIDLHTHMRDPGMEGKEDFHTGTLSAAFGGVTAIVDMPNTIPPTENSANFKAKKEIALKKSCIDFGINLVVTNGSDLSSYLDVYKDPAFAGFKVFLGETTGSLVLDNVQMIEMNLKLLARLKRPVSIHAEEGSYLNTSPKGGSGILQEHLESRPPIAEVAAMEKMSRVMGNHTKLLHFLHVSSLMGVERASVTDSTIEVTPHHLLLDVKKCEKGLEEQSFAKVNPPIRNPSDRAALWKHLINGRVDTIGSDHAPHELSSKLSDQPPSGIPGVETMIPLMLWKVREGSISLERFIELVSINPARRVKTRFRGSITRGSYADLFMADIKDEKKIRGENLHSKCGWTPFEGMSGIFPNKVISRGELIIEDEQFCSRSGRGRAIREEPNI